MNTKYEFDGNYNLSVLKNNIRLGIVVGDFKTLRQFSPEIENDISTVWTDELVKKHKDLGSSMQISMPSFPINTTPILTEDQKKIKQLEEIVEVLLLERLGEI